MYSKLDVVQKILCVDYLLINYRECSDLINHIMSFIFILWIRTGLQNPYGYGNSHIFLKIKEVRSI